MAKKIQSILGAHRAISQRQEACFSMARSNEHAVLLNSFKNRKTATVYGEVSEWLKEHAWKVCKR